MNRELAQKLYLIAVLTLALMLSAKSAFGTEAEDAALKQVAKDVSQFWKAGGVEIKFPIRMVERSPLPGNQLAACVYDLRTNRPIEIIVVRSEWYTRGAIEHTYTMVHELGHCLFKLGHSHLDHSIMNGMLPKTIAQQKAILDTLWAASHKGE